MMNPSRVRRMVALLGILAASDPSGALLAGEYELVIEEKPMNVTGREKLVPQINGSVPGPVLRWREGEDVTIRVHNRLDVPTSLHWHGMILPAAMDGVPGLGFPGIAPGKSFTYRFPVRQSGTYWYHSHWDLQEQAGMYAPIIIAPAAPEAYRYDRDYVVMLSDWTDEDPGRVFTKLKKQSGYYNFNKRTVLDFFREVSDQGLGAAISERLAWDRMRMDPTDVADVTGYTYTFLVNGRPPDANWTAIYRRGERIRLRFINGSAMTYFDVRIPGLTMTVVQADGQDVQPVTVDELRIAVAETYDVLVEPVGDRAYTIFAEAMDRSGYAHGTLASQAGRAAPIPALRPPPLLTMADMGMAHDTLNGSPANVMAAMDHAAHGMAHPGADAPTANGATASAHGPDEHGPGSDMVAMMPMDRLDEPGIGLDGRERRVLVYTDLQSTKPGYDRRTPNRQIELHLTGNMQRFLWGFDGKKSSEADPIRLRYGERVRFVFVNDTMMNHPLHLHGMWSELDNGAGAYKPRKHVINIKPAERLSFEVVADALGEWAFHCHLLYHMEAGMFRRVIVTQDAGASG
ncbi:MAG: copper resistance system multicopper oxidase [Pseudomonadota bacterium]|nr:copper resistance system multicopper oxidase [Gammaproteobacteria bacterium]MDQ3580429.1 copper resistance system multicopper oxidase [Pseudomonadota bacterium]